MKKSIIVLVIMVLLVGLVNTGCNKNTDNSTGDSLNTPPPDTGPVALTFTLQDTSGNYVSLADYRGDPVMINFWATWCGPCRAEMPYIQQIYDEWQEQGLVLLTINLRESVSTIEDFMRVHGYSFPVLLDVAADVAGDYKVSGIPTTFFIDKTGIIRADHLGSFPNKEAVEELLIKIMS